jgi:molybdate transport system substrate-binding protein
MRRLVPVVVALVVFLLAAAPLAQAQEVTLSVAISMKDAVEELGKTFMASRPGVTLRYNFGSSGELQKQIEAGAPVDLFISAATRQMDELERKKLVVSATRRVFARNVLTVIKPADSKIDIVKPADLLEARVTKIVVGHPKTVPAGQYAEESLKALGLFDKLQPKLVFSENVRQALDYVARGEVDAGFVYTTDAATRGQQVKEAFPPGGGHLSARAVSRGGGHRAKQATLAQAYLDLLLSREGQAVLARLGFQPPPAGAR